MKSRYHRSQKETLQLAIFDWAGTTVDYGCQAPIDAFLEVFRTKGVEISLEVARDPMGMEKKDHIRAVTTDKNVAQTWINTHGRSITENDIDTMYDEFVRLLLLHIAEKSTLIPGVAEAVRVLRKLGIKIGSCTGYFSEAAAIVAQGAAKEGYVPDYSICASDVSAGRPAPWMIYRIMEQLEVYPTKVVANIGDTPVDVESGRNAGVWSIGVAETGNQMGLTQKEVEELTPELHRHKLEQARLSLTQAGAHWVIDTMAELPGVINNINLLLMNGKTP